MLVKVTSKGPIKLHKWDKIKDGFNKNNYCKACLNCGHLDSNRTTAQHEFCTLYNRKVEYIQTCGTYKEEN